MKRLLLLLAFLIFFLKVNAQQDITINTLAVTTQPTRFEVARIYIDAANWNVSGNLEVDLKEKYFSAGLKKTYTVSYGYQVAPAADLKDMSGIGTNDFQLSMGTEVTVYGTIKYVPVYIDLRYYARVDVVLRTNWNVTDDASNNSQGHLYYNQSPTGFDISDFTADGTVNISNSAAQTILYGKVGIGTLTPNANLQIAGTMLSNGAGANLDGANLSYLSNSANLLVGWNRSAGNGETDFVSNQGPGSTGGFSFKNYDNNGTESQLMWIRGDGNVGIGTSAPQSKLHVGSSTTDVISIGATDYGGNAAQALAGIKAGEMPNGFGGSMEFQTLTWGQAPYALTTKMIIQGNSGNVGIGTTTPNAALVVNNGELTVNANGSLTQGGEVFRAHNQSDANILIASPIGGVTGGSALVAINDAGNTIEPMEIRASPLIISDGSLAIGTADPRGFKLAVNGSVIAESMTVQLHANWPDYVFKPSYVFPTLTEVKTYIDKNQHLPEMPSEQEIAEKGLNLGEMNKLLVKKVEELTLYLIEKDKQVNNLSEKLQQQDEQLKKLQQEFETLRKQ